MLCTTTSLCLSLYNSEANSDPDRVVFILKMSNNQKETSKGPMHIEGRGKCEDRNVN